MIGYWFAATLELVAPVPAGTTPSATPTPYAKVVEQMRSLEQQYPAYAKVFSIGTNDDGDDIFALRVSTKPEIVDHQKIGHIVVATHHGNEAGAPAFALYFLDDLIRRYAATPDAEALKTREYTVIPVLNISGFNADERLEHDVDPNRDYPSPCLSQDGGALKSVKVLMDLFQTRTFVGSVTVHGYDGSLSYPWGMVADNYVSKDQDRYDALFAHAAERNNYRSGNGAELIYPANGCYEDWVYWRYGAWSMLVELRDGGPADILATTQAIASYFDELDASPLTSNPSTANQFIGQCLDERRNGLPARLE